MGIMKEIIPEGTLDSDRRWLIEINIRMSNGRPRKSCFLVIEVFDSDRSKSVKESSSLLSETRRMAVSLCEI